MRKEKENQNRNKIFIFNNALERRREEKRIKNKKTNEENTD